MNGSPLLAAMVSDETSDPVLDDPHETAAGSGTCCGGRCRHCDVWRSATAEVLR